MSFTKVIAKSIQPRTSKVQNQHNDDESVVEHVIEETMATLAHCGVPVLRGNDELVINDEDLVGAGAFGKVLSASDGERCYAIKTLPFGSKSERSRALWEIMFARGAGEEDGVAELLAVQFVLPESAGEPLRVGLVMQMFELGNLSEVLSDLHDEKRLFGESMDLQVLYAFAYDLLNALVSVHKAGIVHLDVKPGNVLLSDSGQLVLCDFGISQRQADLGEFRTGCIGSAGYAAPEARDLSAGCNLSCASDIYSAGKIMKEILSCGDSLRKRSDVELKAELASLRERHSSCQHQLFKFGRRCLAFEWPTLEGGDVDQELVELVEEMLHEDPRKRPTAQQALDVVQETAQRRWAGWRIENERLSGGVWAGLFEDIAEAHAKHTGPSISVRNAFL